MVLPPNAESMSDGELLRALLEEGYDNESALYVIDVIRGRVEEEVD